MTWSCQDTPAPKRENRCASGERPVSQSVKESKPL